LQKRFCTWQISAKAPCKYGQIYQNCGRPFPYQGIECLFKVLGCLKCRLLCILEIIFTLGWTNYIYLGRLSIPRLQSLEHAKFHVMPFNLAKSHNYSYFKRWWIWLFVGIFCNSRLQCEKPFFVSWDTLNFLFETSWVFSNHFYGCSRVLENKFKSVNKPFSHSSSKHSTSKWLFIIELFTLMKKSTKFVWIC